MPKHSINKTIKPLTGAYAVAEAMRQINPEVVAAYPITPASPIIEKFAQFVADGKVNTEFVRAESEHSAMSICVGASAAGVRTMTASSSQGLALMWEILAVASGMRLPIVMAVANRALSSPINIHCDHSDSMGARDLGWIQIYTETPQEVYEMTLLSLRLAEKASLPVMIMQDGFITSHCLEGVEILSDRIVKKFLEKYKPKYSLLDFDQPVTFGPFQLPNYYFETKYQQIEALEKAKEIYLKIAQKLSKITNRKYPLFESYKLKEAEVGIVVLSSTAGTVKAVIDRLWKKGFKVGMLRPILFRPFPYQEIGRALKHLKVIAVLDRSSSPGGFPPLYNEIKNSTQNPLLTSYIFGLGGREIYEKDIEKIFKDLINRKFKKEKIEYIGLRK
jgi:pyruvate ferredoxin oxidoreductase alpha subunit